METTEIILVVTLVYKSKEAVMSIIKKAIVGLCLGAFALAPVGLMAEVSTTPSQELAWWGHGYGYGGYGYGYSPYYYGGYGYGSGYGYGYGYGCGCCGGYGYGSSWPFFF